MTAVSWRFEDGPGAICKVTREWVTWAYRCRWVGCEDLLSGGWSSQRFAYAAARSHAKAHLRSVRTPMAYQGASMKISTLEEVK